METKVVRGQDTRWKVLEGAWVVATCGSEFRCYTECNTRSGYLFPKPLCSLLIEWNKRIMLQEHVLKM